MQKIKNEKGITLIALVMTAIVAILISTPVVVRTTQLSETKKFTNFRDDMIKLRENVSILYDLDEDISTIGPIYSGNKAFLTSDVESPNDEEPYYVIDFNKLANKLRNEHGLEIGELKIDTDNTKLGSETQSSSDNVYIINSKSRTIYYNKGLEFNNKTYYRLTEDFSSTPQTTLPASNYQLYENDNLITNGSVLQYTVNAGQANYKSTLPVLTVRNGNAIMYTFKPAEDLRVDIMTPGEYSKTYRASEEGKEQITVTVKVIVR